MYARPSLRGARHDLDQWQKLPIHLVDVAAIALEIARGCTADKSFHLLAQTGGFLHDLGKALEEWQRMLQDSVLRGMKRRVPHAIHGAAYAADLGLTDVALAIAGHHAGIPNQGHLRDKCDEYRGQAQRAFDLLTPECARLTIDPTLFLKAAPNKVRTVRDRLSQDLRVRMLESVIVDADRTNSATGQASYRHNTLVGAEEYLARLTNIVRDRAVRTRVDSVRRARADVLQVCLDAAGLEDSLFSLNAPTGSGKTIATLAFALRRAVLNPERARRIIVVIPYLSIIEQNAAVIASIVGPENLFEHHSGNLVGRDDDEGASEEGDRRRALEENWNAPIVVTTSVRFFESLFSNHPSDLRRLHSVANSVVIFDEVQTLPRHYLAPMWSALRGLVDDFGVTCLLSSATLPDIDKAIRPIERSIAAAPRTTREILIDRSGVHGVLRRVKVTWPRAEKTFDELADTILRHPRVLIVVNLKRDALSLYRTMRGQLASAEGLWHLSTNMCPEHRTLWLKQIGERLVAGEPCRVVSTQLVEAGVDLDFPVVFRSIGPLDSIAQAAGRCDREGLLTDIAGAPAGQLHVFDLGSQSDHMATTSYGEGSKATRELLRAVPDPDIADPLLFDRYYEDWLGGVSDDARAGKLDARDLQPLRKEGQFKEVAEAFRYIDQPTRSVLVPFTQDAAALISCIEKGATLTPQQWSLAQRYSVGVFPNAFQALQAAGAVFQANSALDIWASRSSSYSSEFGLGVEVPGGLLEA